MEIEEALRNANNCPFCGSDNEEFKNLINDLEGEKQNEYRPEY